MQEAQFKPSSNAALFPSGWGTSWPQPTPNAPSTNPNPQATPEVSTSTSTTTFNGQPFTVTTTLSGFGTTNLETLTTTFNGQTFTYTSTASCSNGFNCNGGGGQETTSTFLTQGPFGFSTVTSTFFTQSTGQPDFGGFGGNGEPPFINGMGPFGGGSNDGWGPFITSTTGSWTQGPW
jgi:hypothetical protein